MKKCYYILQSQTPTSFPILFQEQFPHLLVQPLPLIKFTLKHSIDGLIAGQPKTLKRFRARFDIPHQKFIYDQTQYQKQAMFLTKQIPFGFKTFLKVCSCQVDVLLERKSNRFTHVYYQSGQEIKIDQLYQQQQLILHQIDFNVKVVLFNISVDKPCIPFTYAGSYDQILQCLKEQGYKHFLIVCTDEYQIQQLRQWLQLNQLERNYTLVEQDDQLQSLIKIYISQIIQNKVYRLFQKLHYNSRLKTMAVVGQFSDLLVTRLAHAKSIKNILFFADLQDFIKQCKQIKRKHLTVAYSEEHFLIERYFQNHPGIQLLKLNKQLCEIDSNKLFLQKKHALEKCLRWLNQITLCQQDRKSKHSKQLKKQQSSQPNPSCSNESPSHQNDSLTLTKQMNNQSKLQQSNFNVQKNEVQHRSPMNSKILLHDFLRETFSRNSLFTPANTQLNQYTPSPHSSTSTHNGLILKFMELQDQYQQQGMPEFYSIIFYSSLKLLPMNQQLNAIEEEIKSVRSHNSHYHKIASAIRVRERLIKKMKKAKNVEQPTRKVSDCISQWKKEIKQRRKGIDFGFQWLGSNYDQIVRHGMKRKQRKQNNKKRHHGIVPVVDRQFSLPKIIK